MMASSSTAIPLNPTSKSGTTQLTASRASQGLNASCSYHASLSPVNLVRPKRGRNHAFRLSASSASSFLSACPKLCHASYAPVYTPPSPSSASVITRSSLDPASLSPPSVASVLRDAAERLASATAGSLDVEVAQRIATSSVQSTLDAISKSLDLSSVSFAPPSATPALSEAVQSATSAATSAVNAASGGAADVAIQVSRALSEGAASVASFDVAGKVGGESISRVWQQAEAGVSSAAKVAGSTDVLADVIGSAVLSSPALAKLARAMTDVSQSASDASDALNSSLHSLFSALSSDPSLLLSVARDLSLLAASSLSSAAASLSSSLASQPAAIPLLSLAGGLTAGTVVGHGLVGLFSVIDKGSELPSRYNPERIAAYFQLRPLEVLVRSAVVFAECSQVVANIYIDRARGLEKENERQRARELVDLITRLGPTAIKVGQALSIRPDLLSIAYLEELQTLQDRVASFSNSEAAAIIQEGLGKTVDDVFSDFSQEPIAAASLGQVYKARLRQGGQVVAVKVQRPGVLEGICCDLFVLRLLAFATQSLPTVHSDLVAVLDNWAKRFFDELDYIQEGENAIRFAKDMQMLANVTVPGVFMEYTSRKVLTTEWVEGIKLSESRDADVSNLVTTALNCYLIQLLETGFLHADPHPGNLLRTPDGKLCVLDFGLMTEVTVSQQYALIEYISHLVNSDYERVAEDLVVLGFVPPELVDPEKTAAVVPQLSRVLGQLTQGGGARKINVQQVTDDLSKMAEDYVFVIPPYFALILRAFSVLEGIGLENDPDYSIVDECYPYISKRLLTDDSPRARTALRYFLYGKEDRLDVTRVEEMASGLQTFRELMAPVPASSASSSNAPAGAMALAGRQRSGSSGGGSGAVVDPAARQVILTALAPEGSYLQEMLLTELVRTVDALSREALAELWGSIARRVPLPVPSSLTAPGTFPLPVGLPGMMVSIASGEWRAARLSEDDERAIGTVRRLWAFVEPQLVASTSGPLPGPSSPSDFFHTLRDVSPFLREVLPGASTTATRFLVMLLQRQALRLADDLDGRDSVREWEKDPFASARGIRPLPVPEIVNVLAWRTRSEYEQTNSSR